MPKTKKLTSKSKRTKTPQRHSSQHFLIIVVCLVLATLCIQQFSSSSSKPHRQHTKSISLGGLDDHTSKDSLRVKKPIIPPTQPTVSLEAWRGPIQPLTLPAGSIPVITTIPTTEPVVFVTVDDGWVQLPENHEWLVKHHLPLSLFLTDAGIRNNYQYFQDLQNAGMTVEDHTVNHPPLLKLNLAQQQAEVCAAADAFQNVFHHRPSLFRPPYGQFNALTQQAATACGMKALIMWRATLENGAVNFQDSNTRLMPGDIVLTHFQPDFVANMQALAAELSRDHLQIGNLEDWLR